MATAATAKQFLLCLLKQRDILCVLSKKWTQHFEKMIITPYFSLNNKHDQMLFITLHTFIQDKKGGGGISKLVSSHRPYKFFFLNRIIDLHVNKYNKT